MVLRYRDPSGAAAAAAGGSVNFSTLGGVADGATNNGPILTSAMASGYKTIIFDEGPSSYDFISTIALLDGVRLVAGNGRPTLRMNAAGNSRIFTATSKTDVQFVGLRFDGNKAVTPTDALIVFSSGVRGVLRDCEFLNAPSASTGSLVFSSSSYCRVEDCLFTAPELTAIGINNSFGCDIIRSRVTNGGGFGVFLQGVSYRNLVHGFRSETTTLEGVGMQGECFDNRVANCDLRNSGDNGLSISGSRNIAEGNICYMAAAAGIGIWGQENVAVGNQLVNNNQTDTVYWSGVWIDEGYGGTGSLNVVANNYFDDNQTTKTQYNSIRIHGVGATYTTWAAGQTITIGLFRRYGANIYVAASAGTTGATPPTHTTGTVTDGAVTWTYLRTNLGGYNRPAGNSFMGNVSNRTKSGVHYYDANNWVGNSSLDAYV